MEDDNPKCQGLESVGKFATGFSATHLEVKLAQGYQTKLNAKTNLKCMACHVYII
jgi:hypothetical protein